MEISEKVDLLKKTVKERRQLLFKLRIEKEKLIFLCNQDHPQFMAKTILTLFKGVVVGLIFRKVFCFFFSVLESLEAA